MTILLLKCEAVVYTCREDVVTQPPFWNVVVSVAERRGLLLKFPGYIYFLDPKSKC